jgi:PAS domain S-box-containing protein
MLVERGGAGEEDGRFRAIFACAPECIKRVGAEGRLIDINPAGLRMIGAASVEDVRGRNLIELIAPGHHRAFRDAIEAVFQGRSVQLQFEMVGLAGQRLWMDQSAAPLFDGSDPPRVVEMLAITRDITAQLAAERELLRAKVSEEVARSKSLFLAKVGNDLKTPLGQIIGYGELLKESALERGRDDELGDVQRVLDAAAQLLSMLNHMLAISQADARRDAAGVASFDLAELVDDAAAAIRSILHAMATEVVAELSDAPQIWRGDAHKLDQCLRSALTAAAEFAARGAITVRSLAVFDQGSPRLQIEIAATGEGLCAREGEALGHELGPSALKLARDTARMMGGDLKVCAEPKGARLLVRVPAEPVTAGPLEMTAA